MEKLGNSRGTCLRRLIFKYCMIVLGSVVYAIGFQFFMFPNNIVSGGVTGIAMILNHFTRWPVGMTPSFRTEARSKVFHFLHSTVPFWPAGRGCLLPNWA